MNGSPAACFEDAYCAFENACARRGRIDRFYTLGPRTLRLSFAGPALLPLLPPALAHLASTVPASPDLTICSADGITLESLSAVSFGAARVAREGDVCMTLGPGRGGVSLLDARRGLAIYAIAAASEIPAYATAAPFLDILHWWMREHGAHIVHAAALGTPAGGVLLAGKGGAGKSTTALACIGSALRVAADDHCLIEMGDTPTAWSLYNSAKARADRLDRFADLRGDATGRVHADKAILTLHPRHRDRLITRFPARALLAVRIAGRSDTALRAAAPADLLRALAPSTALQLRGADQRDLSFLAELARRLPGYVLEVGTDPTQIAPALAELLADA